VPSQGPQLSSTQQLSATQMSVPVKQALAAVFREAYPLAREELRSPTTNIREEIRSYLNGEGVHLDDMYFGRADLSDGWFRKASLKEAVLQSARLRGANLEDSIFSGADLQGADLSDTNLKGAAFNGANLRSAIFFGGRADNAVFEDAKLQEARFNNITLSGVNMRNADLKSARLVKVEFSGTDTTSRRANPEEAKSLDQTIFEDVEGLSPLQIEACEKKGALFRSNKAPLAQESPQASAATPC
jgi:uncharacterized protein YjbI with pentapeptide repeats